MMKNYFYLGNKFENKKELKILYKQQDYYLSIHSHEKNLC